MAQAGRVGRRRFVVLLMVLTAVTLATLDSRSGDSGPIGAAGRVAHRVVQPVSDAASSAFSPLHDWWHGITNRGDIVQQNRDLREQLAKARAKAREGNEARRELEKFRNMFEFPFQTDYDSVDARVVAAYPGNFDDQVVLNVGSESGVRPYMPVVGPEGLVGRVSKTWNGGSTVVLISDPSFGVTVRTLGWSTPAAARNAADGRLTMTFEDDPKREESAVQVAEGNTMYTCGCNGSEYPLGIPVGVIDRAVRSADKSKVTVSLRTFLDRGSLELVKVITTRPADPIPPDVLKSFSTTTTTKPRTTTTTAAASSGSES